MTRVNIILAKLKSKRTLSCKCSLFFSFSPCAATLYLHIFHMKSMDDNVLKSYILYVVNSTPRVKTRQKTFKDIRSKCLQVNSSPLTSGRDLYLTHFRIVNARACGKCSSVCWQPVLQPMRRHTS